MKDGHLDESTEHFTASNGADSIVFLAQRYQVCRGQEFSQVCRKFARGALVDEETHGLQASVLCQVRPAKYCLFEVCGGKLGRAGGSGVWKIPDELKQEFEVVTRGVVLRPIAGLAARWHQRGTRRRV